MSRSLFAALFLGFALAACTMAEESAGTLSDDLGRSVELPDSIERVVTLAPNLTELVIAAGGEAKLAAVTTADDYPPFVQDLTRIAALPIDFEALIQMQPDLVLATDQVNSPRDASALDDLDIPSYFFRFSSLDDIFSALETIGVLLGTETTARAASDSLQHRLEGIRSRSETDFRPKVLFLVGHDILYSFGRESHVNEMIHAAGGVSVTRDLHTAPVLSEEFVIEQAPEVIIGTFPEGDGREMLLDAHPAWSGVPAVQQGRVHSIDPDLVYRPGPRVVAGIEEMHRLIAGEAMAADG